MNLVRANEIRLHLCNGERHTYYQDGLTLAPSIVDDSDREIFHRAGLIHDGEKLILDYHGQDVFGITVLAMWPYETFFERERLLGIVVKEIGYGATSKGEPEWNQSGTGLGQNSSRMLKIFTEIEFSTGTKLFLEFTQVAEEGISEELVLNHIFSHPSLCCRRIGGGLSIWNTEHIVSWSNFPRLVVGSESEHLSEICDTLRSSVPILQVY